MAEPAGRFRFGVFELDTATGELRRKGLRVRLHAQPFQVLALLLARPGEMVTREEICRALWPDGTFVDFDHGVNSAMNRLRDALGDTARSPRFVETIARRGYRFVAPVEPFASQPATAAETAGDIAAETTAEAPVAPPAPALLPLAQPAAEPAAPQADSPSRKGSLLDRLLASPEDLPRTPPAVVRALFLLLQGMYVGFYVGALGNLPEISDLLSAISYGSSVLAGLIVTAALLIPTRIFLVCAVLFRAPGFAGRYLKLWPFLLLLDVLWALAPFLLLHHISFGLALSAATLLVYSPFAQRSLVLMGAGRPAA